MSFSLESPFKRVSISRATLVDMWCTVISMNKPFLEALQRAQTVNLCLEHPIGSSYSRLINNSNLRLHYSNSSLILLKHSKVHNQISLFTNFQHQIPKYRKVSSCRKWQIWSGFQFWMDFGKLACAPYKRLLKLLFTNDGAL